MKNIQITDNRIEQNIPVSAENVTVSIAQPPIATTFQNQKEDGTIEDITINVPQSGVETTLKDTDAELAELKAQLATAQAQVDSLTKEITDKQATRDRIATAVTSAVRAMPVQKIDSPSVPMAEMPV